MPSGEGGNHPISEGWRSYTTRWGTTAYPDARIYHYAPYEITALRRPTTKYGIGEAFLDRLLRERRFVDLFAVVRGALIGSEPNYSIKSMEAFYGRKRDGEVKTRQTARSSPMSGGARRASSRSSARSRITTASTAFRPRS